VVLRLKRDETWNACFDTGGEEVVGNYFEIRRENKRNLGKLFGEKINNL